MPESHRVRADYDRSSIVVYQAYNEAIADAALKHGRFVPPFSFQRMTWIKPSFLWLMARSNWGTKAGQARTLAVRITREGWEKALALAVSTDPSAAGFRDDADWRSQFEKAAVHVQWDTERSLTGAGLGHYSIQIGLSRHVIREYVEQWVVDIADYSDRVRKIRTLLTNGHAQQARNLLPPERVYPVPPELQRRLGMA